MSLLKNRSKNNLFYLIVVVISFRYLYRSWNRGELFMKGASINKIDNPVAFYLVFIIFFLAILYVLWSVIGDDIKSFFLWIKGIKWRTKG